MQTFSLSFLLWPLNRIKVSSRSEKGKFQQCVGRGNHFLTLEAAALIQGPHHRAVGFPDTSGSPPFLVGGHRHHSLLTPRPVSPQTEYSADCFKKCIKDIMETPIASLISLFLWHLLFSHFNGSETGAHLKIDLCVLIGYYFYFS